jgi:NADH dehydrogenase FAD-containing subunit
VSVSIVFIVGGGFAGLSAARALANAPVQIDLVDRRNYHVFQPLLYQVATAAKVLEWYGVRLLTTPRAGATSQRSILQIAVRDGTHAPLGIAG